MHPHQQPGVVVEVGPVYGTIQCGSVREGVSLTLGEEEKAMFELCLAMFLIALGAISLTIGIIGMVLYLTG